MTVCDKGTILCLLIMLISFIIFNGSEIFTSVEKLIDSSFSDKSEEFECSFYPSVSRFICTAYFTLVSISCSTYGLITVYIETNESPFLEKVFTTLLYLVFGPILTCISFFFLLHYDQYGYTCDINYNKNYNILVWFLVTFVCFSSIVVMVMTFYKDMMKKINKAISNNSSFYGKIINWILLRIGSI